ncbi:MAG TPA: hypothetical protein VL361_04065 [Candidatus Limnocylindrales bacterium]|nr:hypothetical protein [Candidatus Limnocylindrales bacterium]
MDTPSEKIPPKTAAVKIFGVGHAGIAVLEQLAGGEIPPDYFAIIDNDPQTLEACLVGTKVTINSESVRKVAAGTTSGLVPELSPEVVASLKSACEDKNLIFIVAGLGGDVGNVLTPMVGRLAKESGALVLAFVILPFECEGSRRRQIAEQGLEAIKQATDGVICLPNQRILGLMDETTSVAQALRLGNGLMADCVRGLWRLCLHKGLIPLHFSEVCEFVRGHQAESAFAVAEAAGATRSREVLDKLVNHPLLDGGRALEECDGALVSLMGGPDLTMTEVNRIMEQINAKCGRAQVIMGAAIDETFRERLAVTLITVRKILQPLDADPSPRICTEELGAQLLNRQSEPRPGSRFVPPAPVLPPEQVQRMLAQQGGSRARGGKGLPRLRQTQLPLEILSKGRFDKSEPTIHKGEDLDVPTYIRRGVVLN